MSGRLIAVVGPSGAGKDSVAAEMVARRPALHWVRRVVTRPAEPGGEPFVPATEAEFARAEAAGTFALAWRAHGLAYGVPRSELTCLEAGRDALVNLSRGALPEAQARFPSLVALHVTAPPALRAQRLAARGRESLQEIAGRLAREAPLPDGVRVVQIDNSTTLAAAAEAALSALDRQEALP
ncbi:MAG: phosphonate metabolism protein/1,5-bisphosphokinase (PRPP-forming) PhnN [Paracoccaceae bacterium]|jgi:ribose 1,5-bisphosphokinase|nr:phosphonate metabolism protein/1,5-bisphosphokinase (PRPP-forming) PhnN [Paracoccaceae bacterium]